MHEYGLMEAIVARALEEAGAKHATAVAGMRVEVGELAYSSREALETAFRVLTRDTPLEDARLELSEKRSRLRCEGCSLEGTADAFDLGGPHGVFAPFCTRCGSLLTVLEGRGVTLTQLTLNVPDSPGETEEAEAMRTP